jgi:hypothetical protein
MILFIRSPQLLLVLYLSRYVRRVRSVTPSGKNGKTTQRHQPTTESGTARGRRSSVRRVRPASTVRLTRGSRRKRPVNGLRVSGGASRARRGSSGASVEIALIHDLSARRRGPGRARCGAGTAKPPGAGGRRHLWGRHATQGDGGGASPPNDRVAGHLPSERSDHPSEPRRQPGHNRGRRRKPDATGTLRAGDDVPPLPSRSPGDDAALRRPHLGGRVDLITRRLAPGDDHREQRDRSAHEDHEHQREEQPGTGRGDDPGEHERSDHDTARHRARATKIYGQSRIRGRPSPPPDDTRPGNRLELRQRCAGYRARPGLHHSGCEGGLDLSAPPDPSPTLLDLRLTM